PGIQPGNAERREDSRQRLSEPPVLLDPAQREVVEATIRDHCRIRQWRLHAVNARTNHVHLVVTAGAPPEDVMRQFKAWCARRLSERAAPANTQAKTAPRSKNGRRRWWTEHGSTKWINDEAYLSNAVRYVIERQ